jgi:hypothetical protein
MESYEGTSDTDESHGHIARALPKPATAIAIDGQAGNDANDDDDYQRLKRGCDHPGIPMI